MSPYFNRKDLRRYGYTSSYFFSILNNKDFTEYNGYDEIYEQDKYDGIRRDSSDRWELAQEYEQDNLRNWQQYIDNDVFDVLVEFINNKWMPTKEEFSKLCEIQNDVIHNSKLINYIISSGYLITQDELELVPSIDLNIIKQNNLHLTKKVLYNNIDQFSLETFYMFEEDIKQFIDEQVFHDLLLNSNPGFCSFFGKIERFFTPSTEQLIYFFIYFKKSKNKKNFKIFYSDLEYLATNKPVFNNKLFQIIEKYSPAQQKKIKQIFSYAFN